MRPRREELTAAGTAIALTGVMSTIPAATAERVRAQPSAAVAGEMGELKRALLPLLHQIYRFVSSDDLRRYTRAQHQGGTAKHETPSP